MSAPRRRKTGYSLVELMMVVAVVGGISMIAPRLLIQLQNFFLLTSARNDIQRDARTVIDIVNRFIRQAKYRSIIIDTPSGSGPYSRIRFNHVDGRRFTYYQATNSSMGACPPGSVCLVQNVKVPVDVNPNDSGVNSILTKNLVYVAFTFPRSDFPRLVSVSMTVGKTIYLGRRKELELTVQKIRVMN